MAHRHTRETWYAYLTKQLYVHAIAVVGRLVVRCKCYCDLLALPWNNNTSVISPDTGMVWSAPVPSHLIQVWSEQHQYHLTWYRYGLNSTSTISPDTGMVWTAPIPSHLIQVWSEQHQYHLTWYRYGLNNTHHIWTNTSRGWTHTNIIWTYTSMVRIPTGISGPTPLLSSGHWSQHSTTVHSV